MFFKQLNFLAIKFMPSWIYQFLIGKWDKRGLEKYYKNTNWIFISHIVTFVSSFLIFAVIARYLGPENLGKLNYAQSFVAIFSIFAGLGIDQILKKDLIANPEKENELIGTAFFSKLFFGFITFFVLLIIAIFVDNDKVLTILIAISGFVFIINPINVIGILFDSKVDSKYNSYSTILIAILLPIIKLLIIYFNKGIIYFTLTLILEALVGASITFYFYKKNYSGSFKNWKINLNILKQLLKNSWPLILAGLSTTIYSRIDQVMLQHMLGSSSVGLYAGATKITSIIQTFPGIIIASLFPAIVNAKKNDRGQYLNRIKSIVIFCIGLTILIILPIVTFSSFIINIVLGPEFIESVVVLKIHAWASIGIVTVAIIQNYLITENLGKIFFKATFIGAFINTILNVLLIQKFGINGAAFATLVSYIFVILIVLIHKNLKDDLKHLLCIK